MNSLVSRVRQAWVSRDQEMVLRLSVLAGIATLDMLSTALLVFGLGSAEEWNFLLALVIPYGLWAFLLVKSMTFMPAIIFLYWHRRVPLARKLALVATVAYASLYVVLVAGANLKALYS